MEYPPRLTCGGRGTESPRQIVRYLLFLPFKLLTALFSSDRLEQILYQLSKAIVSAISATQPIGKPIQDVLSDLKRLENRPRCLTEMAYKWCSVICQNYQSLGDASLLPLALRAGFRHLDPRAPRIPGELTHTEHHRELVGFILGGGDSEAIADLLRAWTSHGPALKLLSTCTGHLVDLHNRMYCSSRLRRLVIRSTELICHKGFEEGGIGKFVEFLNHLRVGVEDMINRTSWASILLYTIQSSKGARLLSNHSWELLVELTILRSWWPRGHTYNPQVTVSLLEAREWDKLECWMGVVWMAWPPQIDAKTGDVERAMILLLRQRPGAVQKLTQWMKQWSEGYEEVPEVFQRICKQPHEMAQLDLL